jgi:hypothetical protein
MLGVAKPTLIPIFQAAVIGGFSCIIGTSSGLGCETTFETGTETSVGAGVVFIAGRLFRCGFGADLRVDSLTATGLAFEDTAFFRAARAATGARRTATGAFLGRTAGRVRALRTAAAGAFSLLLFACFLVWLAPVAADLADFRTAADFVLRTAFFTFAAGARLTAARVPWVRAGFFAPNFRSFFSTSISFFVQARCFFSSFLRSLRIFLVMSVMVVS